MNEQLHQELYDKLKEECHDPTNLYRWILKRFEARNTRQPQTELKKITAEAYQKGYSRAQSDAVKMIENYLEELENTITTESIKAIKLNGAIQEINNLLNQIKK